ncbi:MAG: fasciclin domain-containing protein [Saprospiraceae bacterium]|nr:fasciclin domain-containing protein [Saprospiraceae bacterium]
MKNVIVILCLAMGVFTAQGQSIMEQASTNPDLSTFVTACKAADLQTTLEGDGPFTVFAPSNDAFATLTAGTLESLLQPENKDQLVAILSYHVIPGKVASIDVTEGKSPTVQGEEVDITVDADDVIKVNNATVTTADVEATNGVMHVIDQVIMPPSQLKN